MPVPSSSEAARGVSDGVRMCHVSVTVRDGLGYVVADVGGRGFPLGEAS